MTDSCTYLATGQVQRAFGGPVTVDPTNRGSNLPGTCGYLIGNQAQPSAALVAVNLFPGFFRPQGETAVDVVESQRATDAQGGPGVLDAHIGQHGYFNVSQAAISLVATPKFAFTLQWLPLPFGTPLTPAVRSKLTVLAQVVIAEAQGRH